MGRDDFIMVSMNRVYLIMFDNKLRNSNNSKLKLNRSSFFITVRSKFFNNSILELEIFKLLYFY